MTDEGWLTLEQFLVRYQFKSKTSRVHVMHMARAGRIPGAKKKLGRWLFDSKQTDRWDEAKRR